MGEGHVAWERRLDILISCFRNKFLRPIFLPKHEHHKLPFLRYGSLFRRDQPYDEQYVDDGLWIGVRKEAAHTNITMSGDASVLLDSGSTFTYMKPGLVRAIITAIAPDAPVKFSSSAGKYYELPCELQNAGHSMTFEFNNSHKVTVPLDNFITKSEDKCILAIFQQSLGTLGASFMKLVYAMFDMDAKTISLAEGVQSSQEDIEVLAAL